jgi:hypothetical protein
MSGGGAGGKIVPMLHASDDGLRPLAPAHSDLVPRVTRPASRAVGVRRRLRPYSLTLRAGEAVVDAVPQTRCCGRRWG